MTITRSSPLEVRFEQQLRLAGLGGYVREFRFHPERRWRVDFCWPADKLVVEVEGGTWQALGHNVGEHYHRDIQKYNELALMGYRLLRVSSDMIRDGRAIRLVERVIEAAGEK